MLSRRRFATWLAGSGVAVAATPYASTLSWATVAGGGEAFSFGALVEAARTTAAKPYIPLVGVPLSEALVALPPEVADSINFRADKMVFVSAAAGLRLAPRLRMGSGRPVPLQMYIVEGDRASALSCNANDFDFAATDPALFAGSAEFGGFDLQTAPQQFNQYESTLRFDRNDTLRLRAPDGVFGMAARFMGNAVGDAVNEDIPIVRAAYIAMPGRTSCRVYLTIEGRSGAGVLTLDAGSASSMAVSGVFFPRTALTKVCLAPLSAMVATDDDSPQRRICSADGLRMRTSSGEVLWRPLRNHRKLTVTSFADSTPQSMALVLRQRHPDTFADPAHDYGRMPSYEVLPREGFTTGRAVLTEIPTNSPRHDNIILHWQPDAVAIAGAAFNFGYTLRLFNDAPEAATPLRVLYSRRSSDGKQHRFTVHFTGAEYYSRTPQALTAEVIASTGTITQAPEVTFYDNGQRVAASFVISPDAASVVELRCCLKEGEGASARTVSEVWTTPWFAYDV